MLSAPFILHTLNEVYGIKPGDVGYTQYLKADGTAMTPYENFMANGCLTKEWDFPNDKTVILDTKGLEELGLIWYDPNACFEIAKQTPGYVIDKVEPYGDDQMKITLTKK